MEKAQEFRFEELGEIRKFSSRELQARADSNPLQDGRRQFLVKLGDREAAYLSFDVFLPDEVNLYEVFVARELRNHGVGSACIQFGVELTTKLGKSKLTVRPKPLSEQSKGDLVAWYMRRGFAPMADDPHLLKIVVT
ncbi:MAG TPA: GNAT family N-acetyltransferase [Candidatus Dormibacteraeota bacterium]|nr:GNAT family N-acetyltransferase [Candidatus Dormibacteraeota bacterium]